MEECNLLHAPSSTGNQKTPHKEIGELLLIFGSSIWFLTASVVKFITLLCMLNCQYVGISSTVVTVTVHISAILLLLECEATFCGFNLEGYFCSSGYWPSFRVLSNLGGTVKKDILK